LSTVLIPEIGSVTRNVLADYTAEEIYSTQRQKIQQLIAQRSAGAIEDRLTSLFEPSASIQDTPQNYADLMPQAIKVVDTPVLSIDLPAEIVTAINQKIQQFYKIAEYQFRAQREAEESKRKQIEANGIAAFQRTVSQGISDSYLRWQGIQATLALAQSPNTKIVVIGSGKDGMPIILGNVDAPLPSSSTPKPGEPGEPGKPSTPSSAPTSSETTPSAAPTSPETAPPGGTPTAPAGKPGTRSPTTDSKPGTSSDLSDVKSIISRFSDAVRPSAPAPASPSTEAPK
jgi:hypothetical protein